MEKCIECGGELVSNSEGTFCKACGLEDEEGRFSFIKEYKKVIPDNRSKRFYNSGLSKHKKDLKNSKIDKKTQENLRKAKKIWDSIEDYLPEKDKKRILKDFVDFIKMLYKENLVKTREKNLIIYSVLISFLDNESKKLESSKNKDYISRLRGYEKAKLILERLDRELYIKSQKFRSKQLSEDAKRINSNPENEHHLVMDFDITDPKWIGIRKKGLYKLFAEKQNLQPVNVIKEWEDSLIRAGFKLAETYLRLNAQELAAKGIIPKFGKKEGLICASCYFICEENNYRPLKKSEWSIFFNISKRTFDSRYRELKDFFYKSAQK